jgi:HEAT repeat protein
MCWQVVFNAIFAIGTMGQASCPSIVIKTDANPATAGCEVALPRTSAADAGSQVALSENHASIMRRLERMSDLDLVGHPSPLIGLLQLVRIEEGGDFNGWNIPVIEDRQALRRCGIRLEDLISSGFNTGGLRAGGVNRRSSLRFVLGVSGLAYYVNDKHLVVTTKEIARAKWLGELPKPKLDVLKHGSVPERRDAAFALGFWRLDPEVCVEPLVKALTDTDRDVCFDAAYALGEMGPAADKAIGDLLKLLKSEDLTRREAAVFALGKIGPKATKGLLALIDDSDSAIAIAAAKSVGVMGSVGKGAISGLIEAAQRHSNNEELCGKIATSIAGIDLGDAVPKLRELLKSDQAGVRSFAADTIAEIGPPGQSCASELLPLLTDPIIRVRIAAAYALARIDLPGDFPTDALEAASRDEDEHVRFWAKAALRTIKLNK